MALARADIVVLRGINSNCRWPTCRACHRISPNTRLILSSGFMSLSITFSKTKNAVTWTRRVGENGEEGSYRADEPTKVREDRGHGEPDVPERGFSAAQSASALRLGPHLCKLYSAHLFLVL